MQPVIEPLVALVDDEQNIRELVGYALKQEGYRVNTYGDGAEAWRAFQSAQQDDPKSLSLGMLEVQLLLSEGQSSRARERARFWIKQLRRQGLGDDEQALSFLAGIARELGRKLRWDPAAETFPEDGEACALIDRPRRAGWELPELA